MAGNGPGRKRKAIPEQPWNNADSFDTIKRQYIDFGEANPKQALFYQSRTMYTAYGGARGGGKSHAVRVKAVGGALRYAGIKILIVRRTYNELEMNHIEPIKAMVSKYGVADYNGALKQLRFYNGSFIKFGHFSSAGGETEYQGQEYDWIFMDEATQFTEREFRTLAGCLRGTDPQIPRRFYLTCNPGGVGHMWVKRLFVDRDFKKDPDNPEADENPKDYLFIPATVEDNKHLLKSSPGYIQQLASLPEHLRRAHRYGDWNALSGSYFPEFKLDKHVIKPFTPPPHWHRYRAFDYGLDMFACYWIAVDEIGRCYVYRETKDSGLIVQQAAQMILNNTLDDEFISVTFAPPDMWNRQKDTGKTMAEIFMTFGVPIIRADNNRVQGHMQIKEMLAPLGDGKPALFITSDCRDLINDLQCIQADEKNPDDCAKQPHDVTHTVDALRYFCISRTLPSSPLVTAVYEKDDDDDEEYDDVMTGGNLSDSYLTY